MFTSIEKCHFLRVKFIASEKYILIFLMSMGEKMSNGKVVFCDTLSVKVKFVVMHRYPFPIFFTKHLPFFIVVYYYCTKFLYECN